MLGKTLLILSAFDLAAVPAAAAAEEPAGCVQDAIKQASIPQPADEAGSYGNRNLGGPYGFTSYPRHRHVDQGSLASRPFSPTSAGTSPWCDNCHGSAYYGRDYGAPYFGGGYYDRGIYYRERRDR